METEASNKRTVNRVVVTGIGVIAPNGSGKSEFWNSLVSGRSGISDITAFDPSNFPTKIAGQVKDFDTDKYISRKRAALLSRFAQFSVVASKMAVEDANLTISEYDSGKTGIVIGTAIGGLEVAEKECASYYGWNKEPINPFSSMSMNPNSAVGCVAVDLNIKGFNMTISTGCSAGLSAIGYAYDLILAGRADTVLAGGAEAPLFPVTFASFCSANVMTKRNDSPETASRPFDRNRDGYVLGEGAAIMLLESLEHALARKAKIYCEIAGYAVTNDGYSIFKMEPSGSEAGRTITMAMENAGITGSDVGYINAHGSSSIVSDRRETTAIKNALGDHAYNVPVSSIKSMIGQSLAAAASIQFAAGAMVVNTDLIPPTMNYETEDPECDLDYVPNKKRNGKKINAAIINSFGAGGNNISMVLKKYVSNGIQL